MHVRKARNTVGRILNMNHFGELNLTPPHIGTQTSQPTTKFDSCAYRIRISIKELYKLQKSSEIEIWSRQVASYMYPCIHFNSNLSITTVPKVSILT